MAINATTRRKFQVLDDAGRVRWMTRQRTPQEVAALNAGTIHPSTEENDAAAAALIGRRAL